MILHLLRRAIFRRHLKTHSGEKSYKCNQCDFASIEAHNLRNHLKAHSGEKSNKCNQCEFASSQAGNLKTHLKTHSEKSNKCNMLTKCGQISITIRNPSTGSGRRRLYENPNSKITHLHDMHDSLNSEYGQNLLVFSVTRRSRSDAVHLLTE